MPKAIISNRIYLDDPTGTLAKVVIPKLTYKIKKDIPGNSKISSVETIKDYKVLTGGILSIPQGRLHDLVPQDYVVVDKRVTCDMPFPSCRIPLRDDQKEVFDQVVDSCFINAAPGWGKTFASLHIAAKLGQKTLVVTHTVALRDQWLEEAEILFGSVAGIGVIGSGKCDIEDKFLVVANIQSLRKYVNKVQKEFGLVILDEAHHCPATTFTEVIDAMYSRYRIGLSGTMERKDKKHVLFENLFGSVVLKPRPSNTMTPDVHIVRSGIQLNMSKPWVDRITELFENKSYVKYICKLARAYIASGHQVFIPASRVDFLQKVKDELGEECLLVVGATKDRDEAKQLLLSREKTCIAGSRSIMSEGISINSLSCIILAEPMSNDGLLEQLVARCTRIYDEHKPTPVVVDVNFAGFSTDRKQNNDRLGLYLRKGWPVYTL